MRQDSFYESIKKWHFRKVPKMRLESVHIFNVATISFQKYIDCSNTQLAPWYSSLPNKRTCTPYLILTKFTPCTLLFGPVRLFIFGIFKEFFVKYSGLMWIFFGKNLV